MSLGREKAMEREVCFDRPAQPGCGRNGEVGGFPGHAALNTTGAETNEANRWGLHLDMQRLDDDRKAVVTQSERRW